MSETATTFEGYAIVELMGHGFEAGFVSTRYFGGPAMFQIDTPTLPALPEAELTTPQWLDGVLCGVGTKYCRAEVPGKSCFIGVTTIFRLTPCDEATARAAIERRIQRPVKILTLVEEQKALKGSAIIDVDEDDIGF